MCVFACDPRAHWRNRVDAHAVLCPLDCQTLRQVVDAGARGARVTARACAHTYAPLTTSLEIHVTFQQ
jgi:hypothetical protein